MGKTPRPAETGIQPGMVFLGKYRVDEILGQGGMGVVAACTHLALNEKVAIKMLRSDVLLDHDAVERFMREAQAASKLRSEYVARVSDVGTDPNGVPYMVMEHLDGHDLGEMLEQRGTLPYPWAAELVLQTCEALAEAHSLGIVHRDIKPTNLFVTWRPDGSALVKVLDFGISKAPMGQDMQLTQTQSLLGTPAYMSPEQMRSARMVDGRTDIWSLGTVMFELLEGRRPFEAESFSEMCVKVAVDAPAAMTNTPPPLQQVVMRCLAKSPEQRYANMAELGRDLVQFAQDRHQAQVLVDRMTRMIGRRQGGVVGNEWDGAGTSSGVRANPALQQIRDAATPQVIMSPAGSYSAPIQFPNTPPHGIVQPVQHPPRDRSAPIYPPTEMVGGQKKKRFGAVIAGFAVATGVGIGLTIAMSAGGEAEKPPVPAAAPAVPPPTPTPAAPVVQDTAKAAADQAAAEKLAADKAAAEKRAADEKAAAEKLAAEQTPTKPTERKKPKPVKPKPVEAKPVEVKPVPTPVQPKSDPFNSVRPPTRK